MSGVQHVNAVTQTDESAMSLDLALAQVKFFANQLWKSKTTSSNITDTGNGMHSLHEYVWFQSQRMCGKSESISARDILTSVKFGESNKENEKTEDEDLISPKTYSIPSKRYGETSPTPDKRPRLSPKDNKERGKDFRDEGGTRIVRFCDEPSDTERTKSPERKPALISPKRKSCLKVNETPTPRTNKTCTKEWFLVSAVKDFVQRRLRLMVDPDDEIYDLNENPAFLDLSPYTQCYSPEIQSAYWEAVRTIKPHRTRNGSPVKYNNPFDPRLDFKGCVPSPIERLTTRKPEDSPREAYGIKENLFLATSSYVSEMLEQHTSKYRLYRFALTKTRPEMLSKLGFSNKQNQEILADDCKQQAEADMLSLVYIPIEAATDEDTRNIFAKIMDESIKLLWVISPRRRRQRPRKDTGDNALSDIPLNRHRQGPIKRPQALTWDAHDQDQDVFDEEVIICDLEALLNSSSKEYTRSKQGQDTVQQIQTENNKEKLAFGTNEEEKATQSGPGIKSAKPNNGNCNPIRRRLWEDSCNTTHDDSNLFSKTDALQVRTSTPKSSLSDQDNSSNSMDYSFDSNFEGSLDFENIPSKPIDSPPNNPPQETSEQPLNDCLANDGKEEANSNTLKKLENLQFFPSIHSPSKENGFPLIMTCTTSQSGTTTFPAVQAAEQMQPMQFKSGNPSRFQPRPLGYTQQESVSSGNFNFCRPVHGPNAMHVVKPCAAPPMVSMAYPKPQVIPGPHHQEAYRIRPGCILPDINSHSTNTPTTNTNLVFSTLPPVRYNNPQSAFTRHVHPAGMPVPVTENNNLPQRPILLPPYQHPLTNIRGFPTLPIHQFENKPINPQLPLSNFHPNIPPPQALPPSSVGPMPTLIPQARMQWHPATGLITRPPFSGQNMPPCYSQGLPVHQEPRLTEPPANLDRAKYNAHLQTVLNAFILSANQAEANACHPSDLPGNKLEPTETINDLSRPRNIGAVNKVQLSHLAPEFKPFK